VSSIEVIFCAKLEPGHHFRSVICTRGCWCLGSVRSRATEKGSGTVELSTLVLVKYSFRPFQFELVQCSHGFYFGQTGPFSPLAPPLSVSNHTTDTLEHPFSMARSFLISCASFEMLPCCALMFLFISLRWSQRWWWW